MRKAYPSDVTREQFEKIREDLEKAKKKTHPSKSLFSILSCMDF